MPTEIVFAGGASVRVAEDLFEVRRLLAASGGDLAGPVKRSRGQEVWVNREGIAYLEDSPTKEASVEVIDAN
jgi:hypothetical protein